MDKFTALLEKLLVPISDKLSQNKYLGAISTGFSYLLPLTMVGAIFTLLANLQIAPYQDFVTATGLKTIFAFAPTVTTDMLAVYAAYLIGKACADKLNLVKEATIIGSITLFVFLLMIPLGVSGKAVNSGEIVSISSALSTGYLGSAGLFSAMILGLVVPSIYNLFIKYNVVIKMPEQVPSSISKSFSALIPAFAIAFIFCLVRLGFTYTSFGTLNDFIYTVLKTPLTHLSASPFTFIIFILMSQLMWFFGLHGGMIVMPFLTMLYTTAGLENLEAYAAGTALPNIITKSCWGMYACLGGAGGTLGLVIIMFFFAKSARYKTLGKLALPASLCGINEPIVFGLPLVLNPITFFPLILTPIITFTITYVCMSIGLVPFTNGAEIPLGTPVLLSGIIGCGWQAAVLQVFLVLVQIAIHLPFFKLLDKRALEEEQG